MRKTRMADEVYVKWHLVRGEDSGGVYGMSGTILFIFSL